MLFICSARLFSVRLSPALSRGEVLGFLGEWVLFMWHVSSTRAYTRSVASFCRSWMRLPLLPPFLYRQFFRTSPLRLACFTGKVAILHPSPRRSLWGKLMDAGLPRRVGLLVEAARCCLVGFDNAPQEWARCLGEMMAWRGRLRRRVGVAEA